MFQIRLIKRNEDLVNLLNTERKRITSRSKGTEVKIAQSFGHGCNLDDNWSGGLAHHFSKQYPQMLEESKKYTKKKLGDVTLGIDLGDLVGYNLYTQTTGGSGSFKYKALYNTVYALAVVEIETFLDDCENTSGRNNFLQIALPMIGAGIAGGDPDSCLFYMSLAITDVYEKYRADIAYRFSLEVLFVIWDDVSVKMGTEFTVKPRYFIDNPRLDPLHENFNEEIASNPRNIFKKETHKREFTYIYM